MNHNAFISDASVRALGWTLVHSFWQGALAALILLVLLPRLQTARQRYWTAYVALSTVFLAAVVTFCWMFESRANEPATPSALFGEVSFSSVFLPENQLFEATIWEKTATWLEINYPLIVAVWLLGFGFFLLRLSGGLWHANRLSKRGILPVESTWENKIAVLGERLGMSRPVRLLESALVHAPLTIGWLKPVILLPVGLVNRLSPAEVEAVLAHELAHIARRDWLFNLIQAFIETLFYYHPAVWWMSQVIRNERENCCDDAALAATGNRIAFAKALVQVQEMAKTAPALALGINGSGRPLLLERVRRILNQPQQKSQIMEKFTATVILLALLTLIGIRANHAPTLSAAFAQMSEFPAALFGAQDDDTGNQVATDSVPKPKSTRKITREDDNQRVEAEYQDNKLTRLNVDGKEIPASEFGQYRDLTNELQRELRAPIAPPPPMPPGVFFFSPETPAGAPVPPVPPMPPGVFYFSPGNPAGAPVPPVPPRISSTKDSDGNTIIMLERDGKPVEIKVKDGHVWINGDQLEDGEKLDLPGFGNGFFYWNGDDSDSYNFVPEGGFHLEGLDGLKGLARLKDLENLRYLENLDDFPHFKLSEEDKARLEEERERVRADADRIRDEHRQIVKEQQRLRQEEMKLAQKEMKEHQKEWAKEQKRWQKEQKEWAKEQERWAYEQSQSNTFGKELKAQLQRDGLITDPSNFQFQLSAKELIINGVKQSGDLHRKYLEFYRAKTGKDLGKNGNFFWTENN